MLTTGQPIRGVSAYWHFRNVDRDLLAPSYNVDRVLPAPSCNADLGLLAPS